MALAASDRRSYTEASSSGSSDQGLHRLVTEGTPDLHTVVSAGGLYRFVSAAGVAPFGWTPRDLLGRPQPEFTHPDDEALVVDTHLGLLKDGTEADTMVDRFRYQDGTYRWTEAPSRVDGAARSRWWSRRCGTSPSGGDPSSTFNARPLEM